jgi:hypothetical protein
MAIQFPDNIFSNSPKPVEGKYATLTGTPYLSSAEATGSIDINYRYKGLTVLISSSTEIAEYWWKEGTANNQLVLKTGGSSYYEGPGIDINSNYISASLGAGLDFDGSSKIRALVRQVNGTDPVNGNVIANLTAVLTGASSSGTNNLIASSSGAKTGSISNATVWVVSGDISTPNPNGLAYIFISQSSTAAGYGEWFSLSYINQTTADARYVRLVTGSSITQTITSSLIITGSSVTFSSSLYWSGSTSLGGAANYVLVLGDDGRIYRTGSYGAGGGGSNVRAGMVTSSLFGGFPKTASVIISSSMGDTNYGVSIISSDARIWTIQTKQTGSFVINSNSSVGLNSDVYWTATPTNNPS